MAVGQPLLVDHPRGINTHQAQTAKASGHARLQGCGAGGALDLKFGCYHIGADRLGGWAAEAAGGGCQRERFTIGNGPIDQAREGGHTIDQAGGKATGAARLLQAARTIRHQRHQAGGGGIDVARGIDGLHLVAITTAAHHGRWGDDLQGRGGQGANGQDEAL